MRLAPLAAALALSAGAASAGGYAAPVVEAEVLPAAPVAVAPSDWQGFYVGGALGHAFRGDDAIGQEVGGVQIGDLGTAELGGPNLSLRAGYRWQRDRFIVGPELSYTAGSIEDEFTTGTGATFESKVDSLLAARLKAGYLVDPQTMVFGSAGWQRGDFTYVNDGTEIGYDADGYVVGLGVERRLTERLSLTGEYEFNSFGKTAVEIAPGVSSQATPDFSNLKMGLNFKF